MPKNFNNYVADITSCGTVSIYCRSTELDSIDIGTGKIVQCSVDELGSTLTKCRGVDGVSVTFEGTEEDVIRVTKLLNIQVVSDYMLDGLVVTCGASARIRGGVVVDGNAVNVQIAYNNGTVTVGSPLILGDY